MKRYKFRWITKIEIAYVLLRFLMKDKRTSHLPIIVFRWNELIFILYSLESYATQGCTASRGPYIAGLFENSITKNILNLYYWHCIFIVVIFRYRLDYKKKSSNLWFHNDWKIWDWFILLSNIIMLYINFNKINNVVIREEFRI